MIPDKNGVREPPTCCGTITEATYAARERRETRKPQPWLVRKLMVAITLVIMGYAAYVYTGRFYLRLSHDGSKSRASRWIMVSTQYRPSIFLATVALLTVFCILYAWMIWAYIKVRGR